MKKIQLILIILTFCISTSYSQLGLQGGLNVARFQATPLNGTVSFLATMQAGIFYDAMLTDHWYVTPGLKYNAKGSFHKGTVVILNTVTQISSDTRLRYIEIPLDIAYRFDSGWFLGGGLYFANGIDAIGAEFGHKAWDANPIDLGYSIKLGRRFDDTSLTLHYSQGLSNISQIRNTTLYNQALSLTAAHHFIRKNKN